MKRINTLHYVLELIVIVGFLILGVTILTFISQNQPFDRIVIGSIILAIGVLGVADFFTWKYAMKRRSIQSVVAAVLYIALGAVIMIINRLDTKIWCLMWGIGSIAFSVARIATGAVNMPYQPLINAVRIILAIIQIVFGVLLIVKTGDAVPPTMLFLGIALCTTSLILLIEFTIHRYQRI